LEVRNIVFLTETCHIEPHFTKAKHRVLDWVFDSIFKLSSIHARRVNYK